MAQEKNVTKKGKKQSNEVLDELNSLLGKIPPQSPELEKAVLGAILLQANAIYDVQSILRPESFYVPAHQVIYDAIQRLALAQKPIDYITVSEELRINNQLDEVGGVPYLIELTELIGTASHLEYHARIVQQKYIQRELIKASTEIQKASYDETKDVDDLITFAEGEIFNISNGAINKDIVKIGEVVTAAKDAIAKAAEDNSKGGNACRGVPSGFTDLDRLTSGWQNSDLIIVAARPSMGKTAFVLSMARNMAVAHGKTVAFFSLEMSSIQLVNRLIAAEIEVGSDKLRNGTLSDSEWQCLETKLHGLEQANLFIDDTPAISIFELRAKCRRLKRSHNLDIVIIDYLQLMTAGGDSKGSREQEVSTISRSLKAIAKDLDVPIIALSQLNRSVETRSNDKRPQLSDLRESGAIEQDADIVAFIHRPYYYGITQDDDGNSTKDQATIIVAKHRNGAVDDVKLKFIQDLAKFEDYDRGVSEIVSSDTEVYQTRGSRLNQQSFAEGIANENVGFSNDNSFENSTIPAGFGNGGNEEAPF
ncbi:MAG: replicative DNA helicase [Bacteroidales bacterium]|nr:replicative DNA helicase [Bacteroidales bacterium]